jgi:sialic acid synthase SpsE/quercetin dioxygenase-like cupin family protein
MTDNRSPDLFKNLFVFEMANNHQGSVEHGLAVIRHMSEACQGMPFRFAFKLQYRNLETFIHPDYRERQDIKYVKRFRDTELKEGQLLELKQAICDNGFIAMCTPFDEDSVEWIERHGFEIIKIASCSLTDWPLLERIAQSELPIIASTAGATLDEIDKVVAFFRNRDKAFALMHCVGEYPTPREGLQLGQIDLLKKRYPDIIVGYSTHEDPNETEAVKMAIALGAEIFEKHVGVGELNAYSANPRQVAAWLKSAQEGFSMLGLKDQRVPVTQEEVATLNALRRGLFTREALREGEQITPENCFFAIPSQPGQLLTNDLSKYSHYRLRQTCLKGEAVLLDNLECEDIRDRVLAVMTKVVAQLRDAHATVPDGAPCELSHHYGLERFDEVGATIISVINREYCKKLIILLPGQRHPDHHHAKKEETFHVLAGSMTLTLNGEQQEVTQGNMVTVKRGEAHAFAAPQGVIFEEISTTHYPNDSFYADPQVQNNPQRKTELIFRANWLTDGELK